MENNVKCFKLITNQELVAKVISETSNGWEVANVRSIEPQQRKDGSVAVGLSHYVFITHVTDEPGELQRHAVAMVIHNPPHEFVKEYLCAVSGIALARAGAY